MSGSGVGLCTARSAGRAEEVARWRRLPGRFWGVWGMVVAAATVIQTWRWRGPVHPDWLIARAAGADLLGPGGLSVYAWHPTAQMGPLALVLAQLPRMVYLVLVAASVWFVLALVAHQAGQGPGAAIAAAVGAVCLVDPWSQLAWKGHADDALVIIGATWMVVALARGSRGQTVAALAVALLGKPTAIALAAAWFTEVGLAVTALAVVAVVWAPFFVADPDAMLHAGRGIMPVGHGSLPEYLGHPTGSVIPVWVRPAQLLGGLAAVWWGRLHDHLAEGVLAAFTVRAIVETNPAPAYSIPLVALAILPDVRRGHPLLVPLAAASFWLSQPVLDGGPGWPRLVALGLLLLVTGSCVVLPPAWSGRGCGSG